MTSVLEPKDFGIYALLGAFQGLCGLLLVNPVGQHINRHTHAWWDDGTLLKRLVGYNRYLLGVSAAIAFVVLLWWQIYPSTDHSLNGAILAALAVSAMVYLGTWSGTFGYILNMLGFRSISVGWMFLSSVLGLLFSSFLAYEHHTGTSWVLGQATGMAVGAIGAGLSLRRIQAAREDTGISLDAVPKLLDRQTILKYCLPLAAATGLMWLQNTGYRFWVGGVWGAAELGFLAIGLNITAQIWAIVETLSMQILNPYFFRHITEVKSDGQKAALLSDFVNVMWPIYAVLAGFNIVFAPSLLIVLTNDRYHSAVIFVLLGVLIEFARCTTNLWAYAGQIERRTQQYIVPYLSGALVVWLGMLGISYAQGNIIMMAVALALSGLVMCAAMVFVMQRVMPVKLDVVRWFLGSSVLVVCLLSVIFMPVKTIGFLPNVGLITAGLLVSGGAMLAILWRNPALTRLLSASLRGV